MPSTSSKSTKPSKAKASQSVKRRQALRPSHESSRLVALGLDMSMTGLGLVVWDGRRVLRARKYRTEPLGKGFKVGHKRGQLAPDRFKGTDEERIEWLRHRVASAVRKFRPDIVVIEGHSFNSKGRGVSILHELHGVVKNWLHRQQVPFVLAAPATLKKDFAGYGKASKDEMVAAAQEIDPRITDEDIADALGAASFGNKHGKKLLEIGITPM